MYNYPRLSFVLLFVLCTYIAGIYVSTKVTAWTLGALGVHKELTNAREVYLATSRTLKSITECVDRNSLEYLASAKLQFESDSRRVQKIVDANDDVLTNRRNATMKCSAAFLSNLKKQVDRAASNDANSTLSCFSDTFYENVPDTKSLSSSRALVLAVRALLTAQAVTAANDSVSKQQVQFENQLLDMWNSVDSVKTSIDKTLSATNSLTAEQLSSLAPILSDKDGGSHTKQSASRLGRLSKVVSSELSDPLSSASTTSLETIRKAGRTLHKALGFLSGLHEGFSEVMDTVDDTWGLLEKQLNATMQQAAQLQKELAYAAESTAQQINRTSSAVMTSFGQAQQEVTTSFDILHEHWQDAVNKLVAQGFTPWQRLGNRLVAELTANQRQSVRPENSIQRKYILPDRTTNSSLEKERARLAAVAHDQSPQASTLSPTFSDKDDKFDIDTAVLRASLVDVGAFVTQVIFYVDVGRLTVLVVDLAVGLITESYSDMPVLDIRGITTVDTVGSVCEVFLCKHSLWAICYAIVANASELMRVMVRFVLLFFAASVVTAGLFMWKQDHIKHCESAATPNSSQTAIQSIARAFFENSGNRSKSVVDPLDEIERYTNIINDSIRIDYDALKLDSAAVWVNQSAASDDFGNCATTTSTLVRMLQDCTEHTSDVVALADDASLSSQCLTSGLRNASGLVTPSRTAELLSGNAPFLAPSAAFVSCFAENEMLHIGREEVVDKLQHSLACATEKAVYLSVASWWVLVVVFVANRFAARMVIKAAGVFWWRFLSANRLQFTGFCREDGDIVASNKLPAAIQQHLREAKWQIIGRFLGIGFSFACVLIVLVVIFHGML
ncbi:ABC transporter B family member 25 [Phytophthora cinnamomi]|uniref:ABC transporter B family member 25 n=1 Tax=Phytophthora cinnamomi TaxID=4785 RepID=UPI0035596E08|nr:ABC transporter B family member 25 [Phytophthora cinnamomi]